MVSIIIPANRLEKRRNPRFFYKKKFGLAATVDSIVENVSIDHELIVVINNIRDPELVHFVETHSSISKYVLCSANAGVARAWNIGANIAEGQQLCFCNDDVEVGKGAVETLVSVLDSRESVGQVGPAGGLWEGVQSGKRVGTTEIEEADEISGFLFVIKARVYEEVGGFDNEYTPAGFEEIDMSFKIRGKGYQCLVVPNVDVTHWGHHGISSTRTRIEYLGKSIDTVELNERNKAYFLKKWLP
jgi:GT2 family glycosyltransferase